MPKFKDTGGREWLIEINVTTIKRIKALLDIDLLGYADGTVIETLLTDPVALCDVIYVACKPQADEAGVTDEQFGQAMAGDVIAEATDALLQGLVSFSPSPKDRANLGQVLKRTRAVMDKARDLATAEIESGAIEKAAEQVLANVGKPSTNSPESSE